jgi:PST family polysaccharide transporter
MNQVTLVLSSMQTFFLPTLAASGDARDRSRHVSHALVVAAVVTAPLAIAIAALKPQVIGALYSAEFNEAARYLRWTLIGDYLKVASWILSVSMVATADLTGFLIADVSAFGTFVISAALLAQRLSHAEAAACAFVLMYAVHFLVCTWGAARCRITVGWRPAGWWLAGLALVCLASACTWEVR